MVAPRLRSAQHSFMLAQVEGFAHPAAVKSLLPHNLQPPRPAVMSRLEIIREMARVSADRLYTVLGASIALILLLVGCATPINIERGQQADVRRELASNVVSTGNLSEAT